jgi:Arm DNA-binding domain
VSKTLQRLTVKQIDAAASGTALNDGGGLFFRSTGKGAGKWVFKFSSTDPDYLAVQAAKGSSLRQREMGLGAYPATTLATAREKANAARELVARGSDPIETERRALDAAQAQANATAAAAAQVAMTFGCYADDHFLPFALAGFSNPAHIQQWQATFRSHAAPLREKALASITREHVL